MSVAKKTKSKPINKKRYAGHHPSSKRYLKTYWPYLPILLIIASGIGVNNFLSARSGVLGSSLDFSQSSFLNDTNTDRALYHESNLSLSAELNAAAQAKAEDMITKNYWSHDSPSGQTPWNFINNAGYQFQAAGENLAYGFNGAASILTAWMNSPEHRANILNANFVNVGFGVAESPNYLGKGPSVVVVAEYGEPLVVTASVKGSSTVTKAPNLRTVSRLQVLTAGQASWLELALTALSGAAIATFIIRHGIYLKRLLTKGETFALHHPMLDIAIVFIATYGVVLTRTAGWIG